MNVSYMLEHKLYGQSYEKYEKFYVQTYMSHTNVSCARYN